MHTPTRRSALLVRARCLGALLVCAPALLMAHPPDGHHGTATPVHAMPWLGPPWTIVQQKALQAREARRAGPGYFTEPLHVPGSTRSYTRAQIDKAQADWFPGEHPPMPAIVARGHGKAMPCAACHRPNGAAIPHDAALAGLPMRYIVTQFRAFGSGARHDFVMAREARHVSDAALQKAAAYYARLTLPSHLTHVVEAARVPRFHVDAWMFVPTPGAGTEPLGLRIIEMPRHVALAKRRDDHARFIAYVPRGSLALGRTLATHGDGHAVPACTACHGRHLRGTAIAPPLAGRWPTYLARQLVAFKTGRRTGPDSAAMRRLAARLSLREIIATAAYAGSLKP